MKTAKQAQIPETTWKKLHDAFVAPPAKFMDWPTLDQLARRLKVPLRAARHRAMVEEWEAERAAVEARAFFDSTAPGIKTEVGYCLHYAAGMTGSLGGDLGTIGGAQFLEDQITSARVIWRRRMSRILIWEAMQASRHYAKRAEGAGFKTVAA